MILTADIGERLLEVFASPVALGEQAIDSGGSSQRRGPEPPHEGLAALRREGRALDLPPLGRDFIELTQALAELHSRWKRAVGIRPALGLQVAGCDRLLGVFAADASQRGIA